jgi:hypothetical protein
MARPDLGAGTDKPGRRWGASIYTLNYHKMTGTEHLQGDSHNILKAWFKLLVKDFKSLLNSVIV